MKKACVILAEGFEEVEAITPIDYLRRAGIEVLTLGLGGRSIRGSHGILIEADAILEAASSSVAWDCVVVPGGAVGAGNIASSSEAVALIRAQAASGRLLAAICAAPALVLHGACGLLAGRRFTGFPGTETQVTGAVFVANRVVVDGNLITARAAGCAGEFARSIVGHLAGREAAAELAARLLLA